MRFNFVGEITANGLDSKVPYLKKIEGKRDSVAYKGYTLNLAVVAEPNNRAFIELSGFVNETIKYYDSENNEIEIKWEERNNDEHLKKASKKNVISFIDGTRKEFLSPYDFVCYVGDNIDLVKGKRFVVTGRVTKNEYKGKILDKFTIQNMYEIESYDERKNQLRVNGDFYFCKDSIDIAEWKDSHKIYLNGWTRENIDKDHKNVYVAKQVIFDCHKADLDNENHFERVNFQLKQIGLAIDENKSIACKLKKSKYYQIGINLAYTNGNEEVEFDESQLTENQKTMIKLGLAELSDFKPKGNIYGERRVSYFYKGFDLRGDYADGMIPTDDNEFEDKIYTPASMETLADIMNPPEPTEQDQELDDLFGD